jgi:hypothetical protein
VLYAVAGEVQQQQIVPAAFTEEVFDCQSHRMGGLVKRHADLEPTDLRITEYPGEAFGILTRGAQLSKLGILVLPTRNEQSKPFAGLPFVGARCGRHSLHLLV